MRGSRKIYAQTQRLNGETVMLAEKTSSLTQLRYLLDKQLSSNSNQLVLLFFLAIGQIALAAVGLKLIGEGKDEDDGGLVSDNSMVEYLWAGWMLMTGESMSSPRC